MHRIIVERGRQSDIRSQKRESLIILRRLNGNNLMSHSELNKAALIPHRAAWTSNSAVMSIFLNNKGYMNAGRRKTLRDETIKQVWMKNKPLVHLFTHAHAEK